MRAFIVLTVLFASFSVVAIQPPPGSTVNAQEFTQWQQAYQLKQSKLVQLKAQKTTKPKYLNALILEQSPYLIRHATNPVNWLPWSSEVFTQAKQQNKLIFLSIGYSTCHWCHVMEQDSFVDETIGRLLNRDFIAVKVDRETHPAIDELYTSALAQVTGSAGWPVTALLNHQGEPVFIQSFIAKDKLSTLLGRIAKMWQTNADYLNLTAANLMQLVQQKQNVASVDWRKERLPETADKVLGLLDLSQGGFSGTQKFPSEAMLLFLLDRYQRNNDPTLEKALTTQLDNMAGRGLFDAVHGGFHRYSTDSQWLVPHYEKMLYNQGQLLLVYARAAKIFPNRGYEAVLDRVIEYLDLWLYRQGEGLYSAVDADFKGQEGKYYLRSEQELGVLSPQDILLSGMTRFSVPESPLIGIYFTKPKSVEAQRIRRHLSEQRKVRPLIDEKVITAWNSLAIWGLVEAYEVLGKEHIKAFATELADTLWSKHYLVKEQALIRASYHGNASGLGTLPDYAYFAMALARLYDITNDKVWLDKAQLLAKLAINHFKQQDNSFNFNRVIDGNGPAITVTKTTDAELLAPGVVMVKVLEALWQRSGDLYFKRQRKSAVNYLKSRFSQDALNHLYAGLVIATTDERGQDTRQYFANGVGKVKLSGVRSCLQSPELSITLKDGWHVNANEVLQGHLRPTKVQGKEISVKYPKAKVVSLGFQKQPLSVFEGNFTVMLQRLEGDKPQRITVDLQACSDKVCLLPQKLYFYLPSCQKELVK